MAYSIIKEVLRVMNFMEIRNLYHIDGNVGYSKETIKKQLKNLGNFPVY